MLALQMGFSDDLDTGSSIDNECFCLILYVYIYVESSQPTFCIYMNINILQQIIFKTTLILFSYNYIKKMSSVRAFPSLLA